MLRITPSAITGSLQSLIFSMSLAACGSELRVSETETKKSAIATTEEAETTASGPLVKCTEVGQTGCIATEEFAAADLTVIADNLVRGQSVLGIQGRADIPELLPCVSENEVGCFVEGEFAAADLNGISSKVPLGSNVAGIDGKVNNNPKVCTQDGESSCIADGSHFVNLNAGSFTAGDLLQGSTLAGISGLLIPKPVNCMAEGGIACSATATFPAFNRNLVQSKLSFIRNNLSLAGDSGILLNCVDGDDLCFVNPASSKAADISTLTTADIRSTVQIAGLVGVAVASPSNCNSDAATGCVATLNFPAVDKVNVLQANAAKYRSNLSLAGVNGSIVDCNSDGGSGCFAVTNFPAINKTTLTAAASKFRNLTIAGVAGTLADCATDGSGNCIADGSTTKAARLSNFTAGDIRSSVSIAGIAGSLVTIPGACAADAAIGCVTGANFPALDKVNHLQNEKAKIRSNLTVQSESGTMVNCASDGDDDCFTNTNFPSIDIAALSSNVAKLRSNTSIASVSGTIADCNSSGADTCFIDGTSYKAQNPASLAASSIRTGTSILGVSGSLANCSSASQQSCYATGSYYGSPNCSSGAEQNCFATGTYKAATLCTAGGSNCLVGAYVASTQPLKAISFDSLDPVLIKSGVSISGVTGVYPNASNPLPGSDGTDDLTSANRIAKFFATSSFAWFDKTGQRYTGVGTTNLVAANIKKNVNIFGVTGTQYVPDKWDVRIGTTVGSVTGLIKTSCRNTVYRPNFDYDGPVASITNSGFTNGTTADWWDTTDDWNGGTHFPVGWTLAANYCVGTQAVQGDSGPWIDSTPGGCTLAGCMYKDRITNLNWSTNLGTLNWSQAIEACNNSTAFGGGWRLPTQKEWMEAYVNGFRFLMGISGFHSNGNSKFWTSTTRAAGNYADQAWTMSPLNGLSIEETKTNGYATVCVKE